MLGAAGRVGVWREGLGLAAEPHTDTPSRPLRRGTNPEGSSGWVVERPQGTLEQKKLAYDSRGEVF